ncbi:MAG: endonuclease, partial [Nitrososphaerota archaeon]|nr:endonuclease [Nitrososphaerota archaeon]
MNKAEALGLVRYLTTTGQSREEALANPAVPPEFRDAIKTELERDDNIILERAHVIAANNDNDWLQHEDRSMWYYWPTLRNMLLSRILPAPALKSIEDTTDQILRHLADPDAQKFDIRGLVLGHVQSGKTTNFTALIAKAVDCGYRLIIVLSGIDKGLRLQTQIRLQKQLVGMPGNDPESVPFPPLGKQWFCVTTNDVDGDFNPGHANQAPLQGPTPVLMVVKKNGMVLRKLLYWLAGAPAAILNAIPVLVIDDEADLASIDTRGSYQPEDGPPPEDYEPPSVINGLIRDLLNSFQKKAYVAYTATPFANVLIPHDTYDPQVGNDLYPRDFIVDLPRPRDYFGADELFGITDPVSETQVEGLDVIRIVPDADIDAIKNGNVTESLEKAILGFVLAGAARASRGEGDEPATMLVHIDQMIASHTTAQSLVEQKFSEFKNEWRYQRRAGIRKRLQKLWESDFQPVIHNLHPELTDTSFSKIESFIGPFFEAVQVRTINSATGNILDYENEPRLKVIAIGGNKFSRGLTL